ncbi:hypothetical protein PO909_013379 [Leuciscus waleckii]
MGCAALLVLGLAFDIIGFALLLLGIFANLRVEGIFYVFLSLFWWIMWYTHWASKLSERLSDTGKKSTDPGKSSLTHHAPTRITWGNSGIVNKAYERSSEEKKLEMEILRNPGMIGKLERI